MKQKLLVAIFACCLFAPHLKAQTAYIYVHEKTLNEQANGQFTFTLPGATVSSFTLDNSPAYIILGDMGASHTASGGTNADGELWVIGNPTATLGTGAQSITGGIYRRPAGSAQWTALTASNTTSSVTAIDGAYANQCVFIRGGNAYFYNGTSATQIYTNSFTGGSAIDITSSGGKIAIVGTNNRIYVNSGAYTAAGIGTIGTTNGSWTDISGTTTSKQALRIDMKLDGSTISYINNGTQSQVYTIPVAGGTSTLVKQLANGAGDNPDIAYDDKGYLYAVGASPDPFDEVWSNVTGSWVVEPQAGYITRLTGGAAGQVWGTMSNGNPNPVWSRTTDGSATWFDDERVRTSTVGTIFNNNSGTSTSGAANGNSIMIPVTPGTYTLSQTMPDATWDLGRFKTYLPATSSTIESVATNKITITVTAGDIVHVEFINEKLNPTAIALTCTNQVLQDFGNDATGSSSSSGSVTYGAPVQGTVYHYWNTSKGHDGDYMLVKSLTNTWWNPSPNLTDHGGKANGYFLLVNASYTKDEFYRQRVTNLVPGLAYTISFYAANVSSTDPINANVTYGLQDLDGNVIVSNSTGEITNAGGWGIPYVFTFTATASTADLFLTNNNIGGQGNDIAIDDIALNPVLTKLGANEITPTVAPNLCIGTNYTFSNSVTGGIWTSSNPSLASISPRSGEATTIAAGTVIITYTYTNQVGCTSDTTRQLIVTAAPTVHASDMLGGSSCLNQPDSLFATATGTATPFTYAWTASPTSGAGLNTPTQQNTTALPTISGSYKYYVTATDVVGCAATDSVTLSVSVKTAPTVTLTATGTNCVGNSANFQLSANASGGTTSFTYCWSGSPVNNGIVNVNAASTTASPTVAGTFVYTVTVNDGFCNVPVSKTVTAYESPSVTVTPSSGSVTICNGGKIPLTATPSGGSGTYTYSWSATGTGNGLSGTPTTQSTTASPTATNTSPGDTYTVVVTDGNGCKATGSTNQQVTVNSILGSPVITITSPTGTPSACNGVGSVTLTATVTGGGINTYLWSGPGTIASPTSLSTTAIPTSTGPFTLTVTNTLLCSSSANTPVVTALDNPTVTALSYASSVCTNTKDTLYSTASGGTGSLSYKWTLLSPSSGATIASSTSANSPVTFSTYDQTYQFRMTVTDSKGCKDISSVTIAALSQTGPSITGMAAAATLCTGSTVSFSPTVSQGTSVATMSISGISSSSNSNNHQASLAKDGLTSTYWESSNTNGSTLTIDFGSSVADAITSFTITPRQDAFTNYGTYLRNAKVEVSNDNTFSTGVTQIYIFGNTFSTQSTSTIAAAWPSSALVRRYCRITFQSHRGELAEISFTSGGLTAISSYSWTATDAAAGLNATNTQSTTATPSAAGSYKYFLTVTDAAGCEATGTTSTQTVKASPTVSPLANNPAFCGTGSSISLFANPNGGSGTYTTYAWSYTRTAGTSGSATFDDNTTANPSATIGGSPSANAQFTFTVTVTDNNACTATGTTAAIVIGSIPTASATAVLASTACVGQSINLTGKVLSTTTAPYTYSWTPSSNSSVSPSSTTTSLTTSSATATTTAAGNYLYGLAVVDANNCSSTTFTTSTIAINDTPNVAITTDAPAIICANPVSTINLAATASDGSGTYTNYAWTGSGVVSASTATGSSTAKPTASGTYGVTVTDDNGCKATGYSANVNVDLATPNIATYCNATSYQLFENNGVSWLWTTTSGGRFYTSSDYSVTSDSDISHLQGPFIKFRGDYSVTITDANGCIGSGPITISTNCGTVLAASMLNFVAQKEGNKVLLSWSTVTELQNDHFDIERSADGINWIKIGMVKGHGNSTVLQNYSFADGAPLNGFNYYRLKQVNNDGSGGYSDVRAVQFAGQWLVHTYPNPASDYLVLEFNSEKDEKAQISIQTMLGATIFIKEQQIVKGPNKIVLRQIQPLAQATYIVTMATETNIFRSKFVKGSK